MVFFSVSGTLFSIAKRINLLAPLTRHFISEPPRLVQQLMLQKLPHLHLPVLNKTESDKTEASQPIDLSA